MKKEAADYAKNKVTERYFYNYHGFCHGLRNGLLQLSKFLAFRIVSPTDKPIFITLAICSMIVCLMCPVMSFIATALFKHPGSEIIAQWLQTTVINFPMALCWQIFFAGPLVRNVFGKFVK